MKCTVITDASWCPKTKVGGWAAWIAGDAGRHKAHGRLKASLPGSANAELYACLNGIYIAHSLGYRRVLLQTDCLQVAEQIWRKKGDLYCIWVKAFDEHSISDVYVEIRHVKGHTSGVTAATWVNNWCDKHAKREMRRARR